MEKACVFPYSGICSAAVWHATAAIALGASGSGMSEHSYVYIALPVFVFVGLGPPAMTCVLAVFVLRPVTLWTW